MKKRVLAMLLVLVLAVSMLSVGASAISPTVNLERRESDSGENWSWNGRSQTLTLKNGAIDANFVIDCDATVVVKSGLASLEGSIYVDGDLTIKGGGMLYVTSNDTVFKAEDDIHVEDIELTAIGSYASFVCGGSIKIEDSDITASGDYIFIAEEDIEIAYSTVDVFGWYTVFFAEENISMEWSDVNAESHDSVTVFAGEDFRSEACEFHFCSDRSDSIWAGDDIRMRDAELSNDVYEDTLRNASHPLLNKSQSVTTLYYEYDDEVVNCLYGHTSISAYIPVFNYVTALVEGGEGLDFSDVSRSDWFSEAVDYVSGKGLMIGTGKNTFSPNETVSNAMAWMIIARINDAYTIGNAYWYDAAQSFVVTNGLADGLNPNGAITREAFITMLFKSNGSYCVRDLSVYADAGSISADAVEAMRWAAENGIIKGDNGKLNPKGYMTRAELAQILMRLG